MSRVTETARLRRAFAYGRSVEWLADSGIRRILADGLAALASGVGERLVLGAAWPLASRRGAEGRSDSVPPCCAPACCA